MSSRRSDPLGNRVRIPRVPIDAPRTTARSKDKRPASPLRAISGVVGGILLFAGIVGLVWLVTHQRPILPTLPLPGLASTRPLAVQIPSLLAAGITLGRPTHQPALNQQQALLIASELEPDAATHAESASAQYILLNYVSRSTPATHPNLNNYPAWMILYQNIPLAPGDVSVEPTPVPQSHYDLYVFLDANTGKELLTIWA
jgi:hypothetical protein